MSDEEVAMIAGAFKKIIDEQGIALRAQIAALRTDLEVEKAKAAERRVLDQQSNQRMFALVADAVGNAVRPGFAELRQRTAVLEQRAMPTAGAAQ